MSAVMSAALDIIRRLLVPLLLVAAIIGVTVAIDEVGNDELPAASDGSDDLFDPAETPVFSIRRAPTLLTSPRANEKLTTELTGWVATLPTDSCFVISAGGETLFEHNASLALTPASNMKILTAYAALDMLGGDHRFITSVKALVEPDDSGRLEGDLYVIGGGDPVLMTNAYAAVQPPTDSKVRTNADELADQTFAANISDISGGVFVDESRYDTERAVEGWPVRFLEQSQAGSLSAALLDDGFEGLRDGYASQVDNPLPPPLPRSSDPALLFAANFDDLLEARTVRIASRPEVVAELPEGLIELTSIESPPLTEIVSQMLVNSDNTTAEMLIKEIAVADGLLGSTDSGTLALREVVSEAGLDISGLFIDDGSGLSETSTVTCGLVHGALDDPSHKEELRAAMPVAGETGTLADSFAGTPFEGNLKAKTGFLSRVSALSGYYVTEPGVEVTFALIVNSEEPLTEESIDALQAPLPGIIDSYPEGPPITDLQPKGIETAAG
jgi:D-alanyl-D-alanine carboxypeptidase/D-alanyl-D-alanine-endopeptidase (penicillin-binding protein 4)